MSIKMAPHISLTLASSLFRAVPRLRPRILSTFFRPHLRNISCVQPQGASKPGADLVLETSVPSTGHRKHVVDARRSCMLRTALDPAESWGLAFLVLDHQGLSFSANVMGLILRDGPCVLTGLRTCVVHSFGRQLQIDPVGSSVPVPTGGNTSTHQTGRGTVPRFHRNIGTARNNSAPYSEDGHRKHRSRVFATDGWAIPGAQFLYPWLPSLVASLAYPAPLDC